MYVIEKKMLFREEVLGISECLYFVRRLVLIKNATFWKLHLFLSSGDRGRHVGS
jgi:hypothetical protein